MIPCRRGDIGLAPPGGRIWGGVVPGDPLWLVLDRGRRRCAIFPLEDFGDLSNKLITCGIQHTLAPLRGWWEFVGIRSDYTASHLSYSVTRTTSYYFVLLCMVRYKPRTRTHGPGRITRSSLLLAGGMNAAWLDSLTATRLSRFRGLYSTVHAIPSSHTNL